MNDDLRQLGDDYWEWQLEEQPTQAMMLGDHRYDDRFEEATLAAEDRQIAALRAFAARAEALDPSTLTPDELVSRDLIIFETSSKADMDEMRLGEMSVNHTTGWQVMLPVVIPQLSISEPAHAEAMPSKWRGMAQAIRDSADRLVDGVGSGRTPNAYTVEETIKQIDAYLSSPVDASDPYLALQSPEDWDGEAAWRAEMGDIVAEHIRPAWAHHRQILADTVLPAARSVDSPGIANLANGEEIYRKAIRQHTSVDLTAAEIHQIGLDQIAKLDEEYRELGAEVLGTSDLTEVYTRLREDPELHFKDGPSIVAASEVAMAKAKAAMGDWFGRLPVADCIVKETPGGPTAFYFPPAPDGSRPGTFFVNTADPTRWHTFEIEAMAYHEGIPGHHLQLAIASELEDVPEFRKHAGVTAYAEGWGLYTERLADEMGLYGTSLDRIGMLSADSMRAGRLVVDTGLHAMGWSREQAIQFFLDNSPMTRGTVEGEVDRYIGWPGQALAYMIGRLEILKYRAAAEDTMGDRFDIKGFHDVVLSSGMVPLPTLERMVSDWASA